MYSWVLSKEASFFTLEFPRLNIELKRIIDDENVRQTTHPEGVWGLKLTTDVQYAYKNIWQRISTTI